MIILLKIQIHFIILLYIIFLDLIIINAYIFFISIVNFRKCLIDSISLTSQFVSVFMYYLWVFSINV